MKINFETIKRSETEEIDKISKGYLFTPRRFHPCGKYKYKLRSNECLFFASLIEKEKIIDSYGPFIEEDVNDYNYANQSTSARVSITFLSENTEKLCDRLELLIQ